MRLGEAIIIGLLLLLCGQEVVNGNEDEHDEFTDYEIVLEIEGDRLLVQVEHQVVSQVEKRFVSVG